MSVLDLPSSALAWIAAQESALSGIAAAIVIIGVLFTPIGRALRARRRRSADGRAAERAPDATSPAPGATGSLAPGADPVAHPVPPPVNDRPSIAVLPFQNLSGDPAQDYLADGLSEDILIGLSRVKQFFVIARNSSFTYKGRNVDVQQVARELGVRYVLEGTVRRAGERIRVTAQLVDARTRGQAWAERFDRPVEEILQVDDEVTGAILAALQPALRGAEAEHARRAAPEDLTAWALVNRAWLAVRSDLGDADALRSAVVACEDALVHDPEYAFAHAVLAHARSLLLRQVGSGLTVDDALAPMRRALQLGPDDPCVHHCQAAVMGNLGRTGDAVRAWQRALELDPNNAGARAGLGIAQVYLRQPESALANVDAALRLSPRDPMTYHWLAYRALCQALLGRWDEALETAIDSVARTGSQVGCAVLAAAHARRGQDAEAASAWRELERRSPGLEIDALMLLMRGVAPDETSGAALAEALRRAAEAARA